MLFIFLLLYLSFASSVYAAPAQLSDIGNIIGNVIGLLAPAAAIALLAMLIIGGYQFMTSGGDPKSAAGARNTLTYAIIGIILVAASWLVLLLIGEITDLNLTQIDFSF